jgi:hypothetical protein
MLQVNKYLKMEKQIILNRTYEYHLLPVYSGRKRQTFFYNIFVEDIADLEFTKPLRQNHT